MEGDIKDIVLARLEKRLKDKDEEIRALKDRINDYEDSDRLKGLETKVEHLESELQLTQTTLSRVMQQVSALEAAVVGLAAADEDAESGEAAGLSGSDMALDGQSQPPAPDMYDIGVGAELPETKDVDAGKKDPMRFFQISKNA